jgi:copper homeostasis protein
LTRKVSCKLNGILEIACFNLESCLIAETAGADRIELCENYEAGGVTPSDDLVLEVLKKINIPVNIMVRPRSGNFVYSKNEIEVMKRSISFCKAHNIPEIVFGILTEGNKINAEACKEILETAKPMSAAFHRAVDSCENLNETLDTIIELGFKRVLTSGSHISAIAGKKVISSLQKKYGDKIIIMPGGGIRSSNISELRKITSCNEFHSSALTETNVADKNEVMALKAKLI